MVSTRSYPWRRRSQYPGAGPRRAACQCPSGQAICPGGSTCCPATQACCNGIYCNAGEACNGGSCVLVAKTCSGDHCNGSNKSNCCGASPYCLCFGTTEGANLCLDISLNCDG